MTGSGEVAADFPEHVWASWRAYLELGSYKAAADKLDVNETTIARHLATIRSRLGVDTNAQAADILARRLEN